ncbi:MAG: MFS transporter [Acetobacter aceti]|uniref:Major facilitator superfamily (MFS) profile domain-containing protein n=2 Tax=Acetobacter aceti TaxID=435 RepID=A0A1U9KDI7_ACEAC|nr:hypothetical protein A0U92_02600 [Acetobacter aceti]
MTPLIVPVITSVSGEQRGATPSWFVVPMCWFGLLAEGYDNRVVGTVITSTLEDVLLHISLYQLVTIARSDIFGMFWSELFFVRLGNRCDKRKAFILCLKHFSVVMEIGGLVCQFWLFMVYLPSFPASSRSLAQNISPDANTRFAPEDRRVILLRAWIGFYALYIFDMLLAYGLSMRLLQIMVSSGMFESKSILSLTIYSAAFAFLAVGIDTLADMIAPNPVVSIGFLIGAIGLAGLGYASSYLVKCLFYSLAGVGTMAVSAFIMSYVADWYGPQKSASMIGSCISVIGSYFRLLSQCNLGAIHADKMLHFSSYTCGAPLVAATVCIVQPSFRS